MQKIVNIRIDERLIHGQVAAQWTNYLSASRIMVIDDQVAKDEIQKTVLKMACPVGVKLSILSVAKAAENLNNEKYQNENVFIVLKGPEVLLALWDNGFKMSQVNVGNMSSSSNTKQIKRSVSVTPEDVVNFRKLAELGVQFSSQMVPSEDNIDFMKLLNE